MAWFSRLLFRLTVALAALLVVLVVAAPLLDRPEARPEGWRRVPALFARDVTLRRTAVASAVGLAVSACIFFRPTGRVPALPRKVKPLRKPPPPTGAGA